jgi:hypothetical protein
MRKLARKRAQHEGLIAAPKGKKPPDRGSRNPFAPRPLSPER